MTFLFSARGSGWLTGLLLFIPIISVGQSIIHTFPLPSTTYWNQAYGLASHGNHLYISSSTTTTTVPNFGFIYKLDFNGNIVDSIATGTGTSQGLAHDGTHFYYVRRYISPSAQTIFRMTMTGAIVDSMRFPGTTRIFGGAAWDGSHLWVSDYAPTPSTGRPAVLLMIDWDNKVVVDSIVTIGLQPTGIASDGQNLYYAMDPLGNEPNLNLIYVVNPGTGDTVKTIRLPDPPNGDSNPRDMTYDGEFLWLIAKPVGATSGQALYKYDLTAAGTPAINVPGKFFDFARVRIGNTRNVLVTVQSIGTVPVVIDSVRILYSNNYSTNLVTPHIIPANTTEMFTITFAPTQFGIDSAHVILYHNDPVRPAQVIRVVGMGIYPAQEISVPSAYPFGARRVGSSNLWNLTIWNHGALPLTVDSISFHTPHFTVRPNSFPMTIDSVNFKQVRLWYSPLVAGSSVDTARIYSDAASNPVATIALSGQGDPTALPIGTPMWNYTVLNHPVSNTSRTVKAVRAIKDLTGDGKHDAIISTENYWTLAVPGNASVTNDTLWTFTTYVSNSSAGSIGSTGSYSYQKALAIANDLNGDGYNDVVIGTGGGNERVYAISGKTGQMIWSFGTDHPDSFSLGDFDGVDASTDFNGDDVVDVIAAAQATQSGGLGGRRTIYLFDGATGNIIWQAPLLGFTHAVTAIPDISGDGIPDVIGTVGEPSYKASAFSGSNGALLWDFVVPSATGGGKEVMILPLPNGQHDVILGAFWGPVYRIRGENGTQVWSRPTGSGGGGSGVMQLARLRDINNDRIDEIAIALLGGGAWCLDGATGNVLWSLPSGNTMGIATIPDLDRDGFDEVIVASQHQGTYVLRGQNGQQLTHYTFGGSIQTREVAAVPDMDGNHSFEILAGSNLGRVVMLSGGLDAPVGVITPPALPEAFELSNNYPNPFNPTTSVQIRVPELATLDIVVYDVLGRRVKVMQYPSVAVGTHTLTWDGTDEVGNSVASGVYLFRVVASDPADGQNIRFTGMLRMMLLK